MLLSRPTIAGTLASLGETEASSAGEQLAEGYLSRAVTDTTSGEVFGPPNPHPSAVTVRSCLKKLPPKAERMACWPCPLRWPEFPENCGHVFRNAHLRNHYFDSIGLPRLAASSDA